MGILETSRATFTTFQFSRAAFTWWEAYEKHRPISAAPLTWTQLFVLFLEKYVPQSCREELHRKFEQLYQGVMTVTQERVSGATFEEVIDIACKIELVHHREQEEREAKRPRGSGSFGSAPSRGPFTGHSGARGSLQSPSPAPGSCYECEEFGNMRRQCPRLLEGPSQQRGQPSTSAPVTSPLAQANRVGASIVSVCRREASVLFDPSSTFSYKSSYFARYLDTPRESFVSPVQVSTPVGDTVVVNCVYRSYVVTIGGLDTRVDLLLLYMVDFDVILGIDWLSPCHAILDSHAKIVTLAMPGVPQIEWRGFTDFVPSRVISFLKAQRMVEKGCLSYLAFVRDVGAETPSIDSVPIVRDFPDVFPADLPSMPPDRNIDFGNDLVPGMQPISILPYRMAPAELKELKEKLQELLDKGLIRPNELSWGALVLFLKKKDVTLRMCIDYK
ncbi:uncharacterized protein [Nicotiana sylvestris]|uniref:uncharacterized protein n=1 Tax=Nicotiana sylvestris TaxID=4096 RepID=UPI00388C9456